MYAEFEILSGIVRVFPDKQSVLDEYSIALTFCRSAYGVVEIMGAQKMPTKAEYRAIQEALERAGIKKAVWVRYKDRKPRRGGKSAREKIDGDD